jgi:hypothetical protein
MREPIESLGELDKSENGDGHFSQRVAIRDGV